MAKRIGDRLPPDVVDLFDGDNLADRLADHVGVAYPLVTVDESGAPRVSMLSAGEVVAADHRTLRFALWPDTNTGANLAAGREALLCVVRPGSVLYLRGTGSRLVPPAEAEVETFALTVTAVESDSHDGMPVAAPITFDVVQPSRAEVLAMWRKQVAAARASGIA